MLSDNQKAKQVVIDEIREKFERSQSVILLDYIGLTVEEVTDLRNKFRAANVEFKVLKNTMIHRAATEMQLEGLDPYLEGPTAAIFSYEDPTAGARIVLDFIQKTKKTEVKCGVIGSKTVDAKGVEALSKVPSKEILVAQLLGVMNGPARGLVTVLSGTARGLVTVLDAIKTRKESA